MCRARQLLVALLVALDACSGQLGTQPDNAARPALATPASTIPASTAPAPKVPAPTVPAPTVPATGLMPPPFASRATAATREEEWRDLPGSSARTCVEVALFQHLARRIGPNDRDISLELRSGEFVAGDFFDPGRPRSSSPINIPGDPTFELKIYWIGLARDYQSIVITARSLSNPALAPVRGTGSPASNTQGTFTTSAVPLPAHGRWRIIGASTDQWGCYDVEI